MNRDDWIVVGKFGRPHGIKGYIKVVSFTEPHENILSYQPWHFNQKQPPGSAIKISDIRQNQSDLTVLVEGCQDRNHAMRLTNHEIIVERAQLPELGENEYYWDDLIGLDVINQSNKKLGYIKEVMATGANDVLVIAGDKHYLIPYVLGRYILNVDLKHNLIQVDWELDN